ncbi:hypothetical protein GCM10007301_25310 [Azorhizobium oxalatiphilum]|uniref:Uncharacterized protein n=1 Tax=Azorhizobium oxalatiphilum TaxID=980631 RepID=A0A917C0C4_9HYPH|nr:hypothetical protein [Azorhizobium oxalatiphilum]GGF64430.1 hypothetical protein GCM10007301_25310 [Azorhizobium oxalatiphilum]
MRNLSYAALALVAGLAVSGAASADEYLSQANREQVAVSAQGFLPGASASEALLPANALPTAKGLQLHSAGALVSGPFADTDAHSGPAHN